MSRKVYIRNHKHAVALGLGLYAAGAFVLWDAYEHRGRSRPFLSRLWSGLA